MEINTAAGSKIRSKGNASNEVSDVRFGSEKDASGSHTSHVFTGVQVLDVRVRLRLCRRRLTSLQRYINFIPTLFFGANLLASWESVAASFQAGLLNGGPVWSTRESHSISCL